MQINKLIQLPGIKNLKDLPLVSSIIEVFLPSLVLRIFLVVLPYLLDYMGHIEGLVSLSAVQFSVVKKLFTFQVSHSQLTGGPIPPDVGCCIACVKIGLLRCQVSSFRMPCTEHPLPLSYAF